jgi:glycosyltransferase involved in cell wall biosynthesis
MTDAQRYGLRGAALAGLLIAFSYFCRALPAAEWLLVVLVGAAVVCRASYSLMSRNDATGRGQRYGYGLIGGGWALVLLTVLLSYLAGPKEDAPPLWSAAAMVAALVMAQWAGYHLGRRRRALKHALASNPASQCPVAMGAACARSRTGFPRTEAFVMAEACDYTEEELRTHRRCMDDFARLPSFVPTSINWLLPPIGHVYCGGGRTAISFADHFRRSKGVTNRIIICGGESSDATRYREEVRKAFPDYPEADIISLPEPRAEALPDADAVVATFWTTAYLAVKFNRVRAKFYFVQDFEPLFYPAGTMASLAEASYRFGLWGIVNTPGLYEAYRAASRAPAIVFSPAVDRSIYFPVAPGDPKHAPGEAKQVVFYGRPHVPRNGFELGVEALARVHAELGDEVRIVSVGAPWNPSEFGVEGVVEVLGLLPTMESVAEIYRHSDVGLSLMMTKHPSYQPLEYMASGCATVSNINPATAWLLRDGENCLLAEPTVSSVAQSLLRLLSDPALRSQIVDGGSRTVANGSWEQEMDRVFDFMCKKSA